MVVAYTGTITHDSSREWVERLSVKQDGQRVNISKVILNTIGSPSVGDASIRLYAHHPDDPEDSVRSVDTIPSAGEDEAEVPIDSNFATDFVIFRGKYQVLNLCVEVEENADCPDVELIEDAVSEDLLFDGVKMVVPEEEEEEGTDEHMLSESYELKGVDEEMDDDVKGETESISSEELNEADVAEEDEVKKAEALRLAAEAKERDEKERMEALDMEEDFSREKFEPAKIKARRPAWRERIPPCEPKSWELFDDAITAFGKDSLESQVDDWVVTVENMLPVLKSCLKEAKSKSYPLDLPSILTEWVKFGLDLDVSEHQTLPVRFLRVGLGLVDEIAGYSYEPKYLHALLESDVLWSLVNIIADTTYTTLHYDILKTIHAIQCMRGCGRKSVPYFLKEEPLKIGDDETTTSIYDRVAFLSLHAEEGNETTEFVRLATRLLRRTNLNRAADALAAAVRSLAKGEQVPEIDTVFASFVSKLYETVKDLRWDGQSEEALKTFAILGEIDVAGMCCVLLSRKTSVRPSAVLEFLNELINEQDCVGLLALAESPCPTQKLLLQILPYVEEVKLTEKIDEKGFLRVFDEVPLLDEQPSGGRLADVIAHRLYTLQLLDQLIEVNKRLSFETLDEEARVSVLHQLLRLTITELGEAAVIFVFSECGYSQLVNIVLLAGDNKEKYTKFLPTLRASASYGYTIELMSTLAKKVRSGRFWLRYSRFYSRMLKNASLSAASQLHSYWEALSTEMYVPSASNPPPKVVANMRTRMYGLLKRYVDGDQPPAIVVVLRILKHILTPSDAKSEPDRLTAISYAIRNGLPTALEELFKKSQSFRSTMWQLGSSVECEDSSLFVEFTITALEIFTIIYESAIRVSGDIKGISVNMVGMISNVWKMTSGMNGFAEEVGPVGRELRRHCLRTLMALMTHAEPDWEGKSPATRVIRRIADFAASRPHVQPASISILCHLLPAPTTDVIIRDAASEEFLDAASPIATVLLSSAPYVRQCVSAFFPRLLSLSPAFISQLARSVWMQVTQLMLTRPNKPKEKLIDAKDVPPNSARSVHCETLEILSAFLEYATFRVTLVERITTDAKCNARLQAAIAFLQIKHKDDEHVKFVSLCAALLGRLVDMKLFKEEEEKEVEDEEEKVDDRDCLVLEDDDDIPVKEQPVPEANMTEEEKELRKDVPYRVCRALVKLAAAPASYVANVIAALKALNTIIASDPADELAKNTVRQSWFDFREQKSSARQLLRRIFRKLTNEKQEIKDEGMLLLSATVAHWQSIFASEDQCRNLFETIEFDKYEGEEEEEEEGKEIDLTKGDAISDDDEIKEVKDDDPPLVANHVLVNILEKLRAADKKPEGMLQLEEIWKYADMGKRRAGENSLPTRAPIVLRSSDLCEPILAPEGDTSSTLGIQKYVDGQRLVVRVPASAFSMVEATEMVLKAVEVHSKKGGNSAKNRMKIADGKGTVVSNVPSSPAKKRQRPMRQAAANPAARIQPPVKRRR